MISTYKRDVTMMQESFKNSLEAVNSARAQLKQKLRPQLDRASAELKKVLKEMGADVSEPSSMATIVKDIRSRNPTFRSLVTRFDVATYDLRKQLWWNANMMTAYVTDKAEQTYTVEVKPKIEQARTRTEAQARRLMVQVRELTARSSDRKN